MSIKFLNNLIIPISLLLNMSACVHRPQKESNRLEPKTVEKLQTTVLNDTFEFGAPTAIIVYDSLLIVYDILNQNKVHFFDKEKGNHIWEFGRIGQGEKELIHPSGMTLNLTAGVLTIYDYARRSLLACKVEDLGKFNSENWFVIPLPEYQFIPKGVVPIGEKRYLSIHGKPRLTYWNDNVKFDYDTYPEFLDEDSKRMFMVSESIFNVSPDGKKLVQATTLGILLDFFEITENEIKHVSENCYKEPLFELLKGQIALLPECLYGYSCLSSTNNHLFATLHGKVKPTEFPSDIYQYDWDGNLKKKLETGNQIVSFGVDGLTEEIYAICMDEDNDYTLVKIGGKLIETLD